MTECEGQRLCSPDGELSSTTDAPPGYDQPIVLDGNGLPSVGTIVFLGSQMAASTTMTMPIGATAHGTIAVVNADTNEVLGKPTDDFQANWQKVPTVNVKTIAVMNGSNVYGV